MSKMDGEQHRKGGCQKKKICVKNLKKFYEIFFFKLKKLSIIPRQLINVKKV
jgi:hypothetical protein